MKIKRLRRKKTIGQKIQDFFGQGRKTSYKSSKSQKGGSIIWKIVKICFWLGLLGGIVGLIGLYAYAQMVLFPKYLKNGNITFNFPQATYIYDRDALLPGENKIDHILYTDHQKTENRKTVDLNQISPHLINATLAIEDDQFYNHHGVDPGGFIKGLLSEVGLGKQRGGSTITQQLIKNSLLTNERSYERKLNEMLLSFKLESIMSKDEILTHYLNKIPYGNNAHGIEAAARRYFGKSALDLTILESSILASLPAAPSRFNPHGTNRELLLGYFSEEEQVYKLGRKDLVLNRMLELGYITEGQKLQALEEAKTIEILNNVGEAKAPHFVELIKTQLAETMGEEAISSGGLHVYTTIDPDIQELAERVIQDKTADYVAAYNASNAALTAIDPLTGEILAYVGGKQQANEEDHLKYGGANDVLTSYQQPGSSFKPLVYARAFQEGKAPGSVVYDLKTNFNPEGQKFEPFNYDGNFNGPLSARSALNKSLNPPAVKMAYWAGGEANIVEMAENMGVNFIPNRGNAGLSIGLGTAELTPLSHINSYQAFVNNGSVLPTITILQVRDQNENILNDFTPLRETPEPAVDPMSAALVRHILVDEKSRPSDWNKLLQLNDYDNGAKTGTSNCGKKNPNYNPELPTSAVNPTHIGEFPCDSWTVGFTPHLVGGVWVGNNDNTPLKTGATGLTIAAPIWRDFMNEAHVVLVEKRQIDKAKKYDEKEFKTLTINKYNGKIATENTPKDWIFSDVFNPEQLPTELDKSSTFYLDTLTGLKGNINTPEEDLEIYKFLQTENIEPLPNWQAPITSWFLQDSWKEQNLIFKEDEWNKILEDSKLAETRIKEEFGIEFFEDRSIFTTPPSLEITSPKSGSFVPVGEIPVVLEVRTPGVPLERIEYLLNGVKIKEVTKPPYSVSIKVSAFPEEQKITVKAIDKLGNETTKETVIKMGLDEVGPVVNFLAPKSNQIFDSVSNSLTIKIETSDAISGIERVELFIDGKYNGLMKAPAYEKIIDMPSSSGTHIIEIRSWDNKNNKTTVTQNFVIKKGAAEIEKAVNIIPSKEEYIPTNTKTSDKTEEPTLEY